MDQKSELPSPLTDMDVQALRPHEVRYRRNDGAFPGLAVQVLPSGTASWLLTCYQGVGALRQKKTITLGRTSDLSCDMARSKAQQVLNEIQAEKRKAQAAQREKILARVVAASPDQLLAVNIAQATKAYLRDGVEGTTFTPEEIRVICAPLMAAALAIFEHNNNVEHGIIVEPALLLEAINGASERLRMLLGIAEAHHRAIDQAGRRSK